MKKKESIHVLQSTIETDAWYMGRMGGTEPDPKTRKPYRVGRGNQRRLKD